jgi:hypothetical protein
MTSKIKSRWILLLLIWLGVIYLSFANSETISAIVSNREKMEVLRLDREFWIEHSSNISRVLRQRKALNNEIESLNLGLVSLNGIINMLGDKYGLSELKLQIDPKGSQGNSIPVSLSFNSPLRNGIDALSTIQADYPFLSFQKVKILMEDKQNQAKFDLLINYRYLVTVNSK